MPSGEANLFTKPDVVGIGFLQYCVPGVLTYQANNITRQSKRSVATAICIIGGGLGGIVSGVAFKASESPTYQVCYWPNIIDLLRMY